MLTASEAWKTAYPGAVVGTLVMRNVANPNSHAALDQRKQELENRLRQRFAEGGRAALKAEPTIRPYNAYYARFKKTYHIQLQLESIALKGKPIPRVAALVEAMFMAELEDFLLTAGHDLALVEPPVRLDVASGSESYIRINGEKQTLKPGDMFVADASGVLSCIIYGPDRRTQITPETRQVFFVTYAPPGISKQAVQQHLTNIQTNIMLIAPQAQVESLNVYVAQ